MTVEQGIAEAASKASWPAAMTDSVARVESAAQKADQGVIEAARALVELRQAVLEGGVADGKSWYKWADVNIKVSQSRLRELMRIAAAPDPAQEVDASAARDADPLPAKTRLRTNLTLQSALRAIQHKNYVDPNSLIRSLESCSGKPLPDVLLDYLCRLAEDKIKKPAGRPPISNREYLRQNMAVLRYPKYLKWLKARKKRWGLKGWSQIRGLDWWQGPPHERAARMVRRRFHLHAEVRHIQNLVSTFKR